MSKKTSKQQSFREFDLDSENELGEEELEELQEQLEIQELEENIEAMELARDLEEFNLNEFGEQKYKPNKLGIKFLSNKDSLPVMSNFQLTNLIIERTNYLSNGYSSIYPIELLSTVLKGGMSPHNIAGFEIKTYINKKKYLRRKLNKDKLTFSDIPDPVIYFDIENYGIWFIHEFETYPDTDEKRIIINDKIVGRI